MSEKHSEAATTAPAHTETHEAKVESTATKETHQETSRYGSELGPPEGHSAKRPQGRRRLCKIGSGPGCEDEGPREGARGQKQRHFGAMETRRRRLERSDGRELQIRRRTRGAQGRPRLLCRPGCERQGRRIGIPQ